MVQVELAIVSNPKIWAVLELTLFTLIDSVLWRVKNNRILSILKYISLVRLRV